MRLYLIRHPAPAIDAGVCYGRADVGVAAAQVDAAASAIAALLPADAPLYASPALRCVGLAHRLHAAPRFDARLLEMDFGAWEMRPWSEIPRAEVDAWADNLVHFRPGGGENLLEVAQRVLDFLHDLIGAGEAQAVLVCHAGIIRLTLAAQRLTAAQAASRQAAEMIALDAALSAHRIAYGEVQRLDLDGHRFGR